MRIDKLQLKNFKGFADADFELAPHFNLLIGENGAGKTSVLEGLAVAAASWFLGMRGYDSRHIWPTDVRRQAVQQGDRTTIEPQYPVVIAATGTISDRSVEWQRTLEGKDARTTQRGARAIKDLAQSAERAVQEGRPVLLPLISNYGAGRLWQPLKDMRGEMSADTKLTASRLDGYRYCIDPRIDFADLFRWLANERYVALEQGKERFGFRIVKQAMKSCIERCTSLDYSVTEKTLVVDIERRGTLPFHLLSDGQRAMLALAADIAFRAAQLNPQLEDRALTETPGIVLIDEIDLHLHPRWQRHVVRDLKTTFPAMQFFATTHSPQVISETPHDEIILLRSDGTWHRPSQSMGLDSSEVLREIMGTEAMNGTAAQALKELDDLIADANFDAARERIRQIRNQYGELAKTTSAESYMSQMEILATGDESRAS
jgi:predicted ATP-binding protein involved in virulence